MKYVIFGFALLIGIFSIWFSFKFIGLYLKVKKWNKVSATVISKEVFLHPKYSTTRTPYGLKVKYSYQINGLNYDGDHVYLAELAGGQTNHLKSDAENRLNKIEPLMQIYVNPNDPKQSVMFCEGVELYIFVFCMGLFALLVGLSYIL